MPPSEPMDLTDVDTSVWLALLGREPGHAARMQWLEGAGTVCCPDWAQLEMASGLGLKQRRGDIDSTMQQSMQAVFDEMLGDAATALAPVPADVRAAHELRHDAESGLRAGDALHIAAARRTGCTRFFSLDKTLSRNAKKAGMRLVKPQALHLS